MLQLLALLAVLFAPVFAWDRTLGSGSTDLPQIEGPQSLLVSVSAPGSLGSGAIEVELVRGGKTIVQKRLHAGDGDLYTLLGSGGGTLKITAPAGHKVKARLNALPPGKYEAEPNNSWAEATPVTLDQTVLASGDEAPYLTPTNGRAEPSAEDWYRFDFDSPRPRLVHFALDLLDRDNIPVDVSLYRVINGKLTEFAEGEDPVTLPHEVQALAGNKFTVRVLKEPGQYYIRVRMSHPFYRLTTRTYDPPPYSNPQQAVQTAVDYLIGSGDSWHANTPRRGGVYNRIASVHQETSLCVACHPTHFTLRAQLSAQAQGYAIHYPRQAQFLVERFYNNPRPLYGFEEQGAVWARVISASANVLSRMSYLTSQYERQVSHAPRPAYHRSIGEFLKLYYNGRTKLPPDETNGNTPLVSAYEVAWHAWENTKDPAIAALIEQDAIKNPIDLCYQTLALAAIDKSRYKAKLASNAERILGLQRADGQWSAQFDPKSFAVEFQTGHALWALQAAGIPATHPQVKKGLDFLLSRQQPFGAWLDPLQSYENFRTPFRETQMAVLALSAYFPGPNSKPVSTDSAAVTSKEPILLATALADRPTLSLALANLGHESKLVQRAAAQALRMVYSVEPTTSVQHLVNALQSKEERTRWSATRVFANHFAGLASRAEFAAALAARLEDSSPAIRMQATKGLWQFWFWSPDAATKGKVEDAILAALAKPQHPWMQRNLKEAVYNLADENIRYLYNNWVPSLARPEDREHVVRGRLAVEDRLAEKFAKVLETGTVPQKKLLLTGLVELELRRADVYDPKADHSTPFQPVYNRIGNDVEQSVFFGAANDRFARALSPLVSGSDPELRALARSASILLRDVNFAEASRLAGPLKGDREPILKTLLAEQPTSLPVLRAWGKAPVEKKPAGSTSTARAGASGARPDDDYFRGYVEPILTTRGKDGYACVHCHASHTLFNGTLTTAKNVINTEDPEQSLILLKPITDAESEGTLGAKKLSHGGGIRFEKGSPEYNTILNWIRGTKP